MTKRTLLSSLLFVTMGVACSGDSALSAESANGISDEQLVAIRDGFSDRTSLMLSRLSGEPFVRAEKLSPLRPGRARYVRAYGYSLTTFAMRAFLLDEQRDVANQALQEYAHFFIDNPAERKDKDNFYWNTDIVCRIVELFGSRGTLAPGRLTKATEDLLLELAWVYCQDISKVTDAETLISKTWHIHESENHHLQRFSTIWHFSKLLKDDQRYKHRTYDDGKTPLEHYNAWTHYALEYLKERARKGLFVEIGSPGYGLMSLKGIYGFYDYAEDEALKRTAGMLLDLFWASWAEEQIDGVRGGGKTRIYQGHSSRDVNDSIRRAAWYYLGRGEGTPPQANMFALITSDYRMPLVVMDIALDTNGRGVYEIAQRRMGLAQDGYFTPPDYRLRTDYGGLLKYSYCTPEFILGTLMCEALPLQDWAMISSQNRWHGVIFAGYPSARIYLQCRNDQPEKTYNQQWSVQRKGTLIAQRLAGDEFSRTPNEMRVWFSNLGLSNRRQRQGWVFVEAESAYAAVRPVDGGFQWRGANGDWLRCKNSLTPVIIEVASKSHYRDYSAFQESVLASELGYDEPILTYVGLSGDRFTFYSDYSHAPEINGQEVDYAPEHVFDSPFIHSVWNSGIITIRKGHRTHSLDFNRTQP